MGGGSECLYGNKLRQVEGIPLPQNGGMYSTACRIANEFVNKKIVNVSLHQAR